MTQKLSYSDFYSNKSISMTLEEALHYHYHLNPQFTHWDKYLTPLQQQTMKGHDCMHIVFQCDTSLSGEFRVELFTLFCVNLSFVEYMKMVSNSEINKEPFEIVIKIGVFKVLSVILLHLWYIPYIWYKSIRMKKKFPVLAVDQLMHKTIGEIRNDYGI